MSGQLQDVTLIIPFKRDSAVRLDNLATVIRSFRTRDVRILIGEVESDEGDRAAAGSLANAPGVTIVSLPPGPIVRERTRPLFHRTRILNELLAQVETSIVANYDCDVLFRHDHFLAAVEFLRRNEADFAFPYAGPFYDIAQKDIPELLIALGENREFPPPKGSALMATLSYGGCIIGKTASYLEAGGENQRFVSWGHEDVERQGRLLKLGYRIFRAPGICYHMTHPRGRDSLDRHDHYGANEREARRIEAMNSDELRNEVRSWSRSSVVS